jgi:DNA-binding HxlR family transcriptional regulator
VRRKSYAEMNCSVARPLDVVGDPWTLLIVRDAFFGFRRFEDFQRRLGVPRNSLAERLSRLTEAGDLVEPQLIDRRSGTPLDEMRFRAVPNRRAVGSPAPDELV